MIRIGGAYSNFAERGLRDRIAGNRPLSDKAARYDKIVLDLVSYMGVLSIEPNLTERKDACQVGFKATTLVSVERSELLYPQDYVATEQASRKLR